MKYKYALEKPNFTIENIDVLHVARNQGFQFYHRCRCKHSFIYTVSGMMKDNFLKEDLGEIEVNVGELIFIPKNCEYIATYFGENTEIKIVQFDVVGENLPPYLCKAQKIILPEASRLMSSIVEPLKISKTTHPFYYLSRIYELLWLIDMNYSKIPSKYKKLQPALSEITNYYDRNEKISRYAFLCDMSEANFRRLFHEYTGQSPIEYRNDIRLNNAQIKLQSGMYNVSEAAVSCGFNNLSFFSKLYNKKFGHTPRKE